MKQAPHLVMPHVSVLILSVVMLVLCMGKGVCQIPSKNVSAASARIVARGFNSVDSLKENKTEPGFVQYVELTSSPIPLDPEILKDLADIYKPGAAVDLPLIMADSAMVLFDEARKPVVILMLSHGEAVGISRPFEVDANCYQLIRADEKACTVRDSNLARQLKAFVEKHQKLPVDITEWRQEKKP